MRIFLAYLLLLAFSICIVLGSLLLIITPELALSAAPLGQSGRAQPNYPLLYPAIAAVLFVLAYGAFYRLIKRNVNTYLSQKIGFGKIVTVGFVLQLVMGLLTWVSILGGFQGSRVAYTVIILLLCLPFVIRTLIRLTARDRSYDNFLAEDAKDQ